MKAYRIALTKYSDTSGEGAKQYGGRWNQPGLPAIYAAASLSAGLLERLTIDPELLSSERYLDYSVMEFSISEELIFFPSLKELPNNWNEIPAAMASMEYGSKLIKNGVLCFAVPSVVDPTSTNFVINPLSPDFNKIQHSTYPLDLDKRIQR